MTSLVARKLLGAPFSLVRKCAGKPLHLQRDDIQNKDLCLAGVGAGMDLA